MIKDSGKRVQMAGMVRDVTEGKIDYTLVLDGPMFERWAKHLTEGAKKYSARNWMGAHTQEEYDRFKQSLLRHLIQYLRGDTDEDHAAAIMFNLNGMEYVKEKMKEQVFPGFKEAVKYERRTGPKDRRVCYDRDMAWATNNGGRRHDPHGRRHGDVLPFGNLPVCGGKK